MGLDETYQYLIRRHYDIEGRNEFLGSSFNKWVKKNNFPPDCVYLIPELLFELVINYFADIDRLKRFHKLKKANTLKVAAYTTSWWLRIKPIHIRIFDPNQLSKYLLLNEYFAVEIMLALLYDQRNLFQREKDLTKFIDLLEGFLYHFHHRYTDPQTIELALAALTSDVPYDPANMLED